LNDADLAGYPRLSIAAPLADMRRPDFLVRQWDAQGEGRIPHVRPTRVPSPQGDGYFRSWVRQVMIADIAVTEQYSDALEGVSGGPQPGQGGTDDLIVVHALRAGSLRLNRSGRSVTLRPGTLCLRDVRLPWEFSYGNGTRSRVLLLPRPALEAALGCRRLPQLTLVRQDTAEVRLLNGYLEVVQSVAGTLAPAGVTAARNALLDIVSGVLAAHGVSASHAPGASTRRAAETYVDAHLRDPDLSPAEVARALGISVRTLYRALAGTGESLMAYVRRRRLECAREELMLPNRAYTVSDVAARWHFADASHFIRSFRQRYGETPGSAPG
jgi:AraC-like DNA-binding protein